MTDSPTSVLIVEDDQPTRSFLADNLTADGYDVLLAGSIRDAVRQLEYKRPDVVLLDVGLPDGSGLEVLRRTREADGVASRLDPGTPFLVLSGHAGELERVRCFERGADDFLPKPFSYPELRLRVQAVLRRTQRRQALGALRVGTLEIDPVTREVRVGGERVELAQKEFALLRALATEPTRVFTKEELLRDVWGFRAMGTTRTLDSHACRLRQKLAIHGERFVLNVWGVGYRLVDSVPAP
jgi:DNA-binding response OmpR family regulator